jgi:hypothetical protein
MINFFDEGPDPGSCQLWILDSVYLKHCMNVLTGWRDFLAGIYFVLDSDDIRKNKPRYVFSFTTI